MILPRTFHSRGKLLISGEYLVLHGAQAFAIPTVMGQSLSVFEAQSEDIVWKSNVLDETKLDLRLNKDLDIIQSELSLINPNYLINVLKAAMQLSPEGGPEKMYGMEFNSNLEFMSDWGLGSSSSLISNIAYYFDIDPFQLHFKVSKGSGYDIACARSEKPILYRIEEQEPQIQAIDFNPSWRDSIYFAYLGKKQDSAKEVTSYIQKASPSTSDIKTISEFSFELSKSENLNEFSRLIREHERLLSLVLKRKTIKEEYFSSFEGEIKSLGAWGGDFVLISWDKDREKLIEYFNAKNINQIYSFDELIHKKLGIRQ